MSIPYRRAFLSLAALTTLAASTLVGCGKKEEAAAPASAAPAPTAAASAAKTDPLKIAFAYVGPVGDGGWTFAHDNGRKAIEKEFGDKVRTSFVESVPESADAERVMRDLVGQGNKFELWDDAKWQAQQEAEVRRLIADKTPDQLKLPYTL